MVFACCIAACGCTAQIFASSKHSIIGSIKVRSNISTDVVIDYTDRKNPKILRNNGKDIVINPASLTKMMTVYIVLDMLKKGKIKLNTNVRISQNAANQPPSKTQAQKGDIITVEEMIRAMLAWSANDMTVAAAECIAGSVAKFCILMNAQARKLGMNNTHFTNTSGLYDMKHYSTAHDMARLIIALSSDFPEYKSLLATNSYRYKNKTYRTRCEILNLYNGVNCAKTGFINESWFNLATTSTRYNKNGKRRDICVVIIGRRTSQQRYMDTINYMNAAFGDYNVCAAHINPANCSQKKLANVVQNWIYKI